MAQITAISRGVLRLPPSKVIPLASAIGSFGGLGCAAHAGRKRGGARLSAELKANVSALIESMQSDYKSIPLDLAADAGGTLNDRQPLGRGTHSWICIWVKLEASSPVA